MLFNAASYFQAAPGTEDVTPIDFGYGNDFEGLLLHELGHAIGLGHTDVPGAVMYIEPNGQYRINRELEAGRQRRRAGILRRRVRTPMPTGSQTPPTTASRSANASQLDTDADGFGNACDGDFNNDCIVNFVDLGDLKSAFFQTARWRRT